MKKALWIIGIIFIIVPSIFMIYLSIKYWRLSELALLMEHHNIVLPCLVTIILGFILIKVATD